MLHLLHNSSRNAALALLHSCCSFHTTLHVLFLAHRFSHVIPPALQLWLFSPCYNSFHDATPLTLHLSCCTFCTTPLVMQLSRCSIHAAPFTLLFMCYSLHIVFHMLFLPHYNFGYFPRATILFMMLLLLCYYSSRTFEVHNNLTFVAILMLPLLLLLHCYSSCATTLFCLVSMVLPLPLPCASQSSKLQHQLEHQR